MIKIKRVMFTFIVALVLLLVMLNTVFMDKTNDKVNNKTNNQNSYFILAGYDNDNRLCEVKKDYDAFNYLCQNKKEEKDTNLTYKWFLFDYKNNLIKSSSK